MRISDWSSDVCSSDLPKIEEHLEKNQEVLVQVTKESIGTKGPRVTQQLSLPGRFSVFMPEVDHVGVSRKIEDRSERSRLKGIISDLDRKSVVTGKRVSVRVDLGGRRILKKKKN